jgi:hypothetical protein
MKKKSKVTMRMKHKNKPLVYNTSFSPSTSNKKQLALCLQLLGKTIYQLVCTRQAWLTVIPLPCPSAPYSMPVHSTAHELINDCTIALHTTAHTVVEKIKQICYLRFPNPIT